MSVGLGIFLSAIVVAIVILYGITKDRWRWRRVLSGILLIFASILVVAAALIGILHFWDEIPALVSSQIEYASIRLGMTPDEVIYVNGYPSAVLGDNTHTDESGIWQQVIEVKDLEKGKRVQDYGEWAYNTEKSRVRITFNEAKNAVIVIECYSEDRLSRCPPIAGVTDGDTEKKVIRRLGNPDTARIEGVTKFMTYDKLGIFLWLAQERVYMLGINDRKYKYRRH
jgi:hypothetical protein